MKSPYLHLIIWLVICVATFVGYALWYNAVADKSTAVAALQNQIDVKTETSARVAAARSALAEISGDESLVQSYFVPETGVVSFIDGLEALAKAQNADMKVLSVSTDGTAAQSNLALLFTISIDGTFDSVMRTIGAIEYAPYDISVSKLSLNQAAKDAWHADMELTIGSVPQSSASTTTP
jgi:hypothetical protein